MSTSHDPAPQESAKTADQAAQQPVESDWQRKRRLAEIFGDVLPSTTSDERDPGTSKGQRRSASEEWLLSQVPPHHGGHG